MTTSSPSLAEIACRPDRVHEVRTEDAARLLAELAGLTLALTAQLCRATPSSEPGESRWLTAEECAAVAGVSRRQVYGWSRRADWRPFARRLSRKVLRVEEEGFRRWLAREGSKRP